MYVNSDDVIKCFLAYLCHKSQAPGNLQQRHVKDYVCELWCADSHFRCLWAYHSGMKMPEQTNVIVWAKINSRRLLCMMAWSRMMIYFQCFGGCDNVLLWCLPQGPSLNARWHYMTAFSYGLALPWLNPEDLNEAEGNMARQPVI